MYDEVYTRVPYPSPSCVDPNVVNVSELLFSRMYAGYNKYNTNTTREDLTTEQWLQHLQEELLDAAVYIQVLKGRFNGR